MGGDLTDEIDGIKSSLGEIDDVLTPLFKQLADLRKAVCELQEDLKHEESRNEDLQNMVQHYESFVDTQPDLFTAWQVANRMEE